MTSPGLALFDHGTRNELDRTVRRTFNAYMAGTPGGTFKRALPRSDDASYLYSPETLLPDLTVFLSLFGATYEVVKRAKPALTGKKNTQTIIDADPRLGHEFWRIFQERGEYWRSEKKDPAKLRNVSYGELAADHIHELWRTLRNGFAHAHWHFDDLSDDEYWRAQEWDLGDAHPDFKLGSRPRNNYIAYVADAAVQRWDPRRFWKQEDLRIFVVPYATLRYSLHLLLNIFLNDRRQDVFGNDLSAAPCFAW